MQFTEEACLILSVMDKESDNSIGSWFGSIDKSESRQALRQYLGAFVETMFMPTLFMDYK